MDNIRTKLCQKWRNTHLEVSDQTFQIPDNHFSHLQFKSDGVLITPEMDRNNPGSWSYNRQKGTITMTNIETHPVDCELNDLTETHMILDCYDAILGKVSIVYIKVDHF